MEAQTIGTSLQWELSVNRDYIFLVSPIKLVERLFRINLSQYSRLHRNRIQSIYRAIDAELYIPEELQHIVEAVFEVTDLPPPSKGAFSSKRYAWFCVCVC